MKVQQLVEKIESAVLADLEGQTAALHAVVVVSSGLGHNILLFSKEGAGLALLEVCATGAHHLKSCVILLRRHENNPVYEYDHDTGTLSPVSNLDEFRAEAIVKLGKRLMEAAKASC